MSSTIYHLDAEGEITEYMYGLPVREAFRMAIISRQKTLRYVQLCESANQLLSCKGSPGLFFWKK